MEETEPELKSKQPTKTSKKGKKENEVKLQEELKTTKKPSKKQETPVPDTEPTETPPCKRAKQNENPESQKKTTAPKIFSVNFM